MRNQNLGKQRLNRLKNNPCKLGEPDLFSITKLTTIKTFLSQKKIVQVEQYFVAGLNFPTTAHLSTYINLKLNHKSNQNQENMYKIKLFMFDAYRQIDFLVEISIPGSMDLKGYSLNGQPVAVSEKDYDQAYFSSILRSFYPHPYHSSMKLYPDVDNYQVLAVFLKKFIPFSCTNFINSEIDPRHNFNEEQQIFNLGLELVIKYITEKRLWKFIKIIQEELRKNENTRGYLLNLQVMFIKGDYEQIILQTAEKLMNSERLSQDLIMKLRQIQLKSLIKLKKGQQCELLRQGLIRSGCLDEDTWSEILSSTVQENDSKVFLKLLNTCFSFFIDQESLQEKLRRQIYPNPLQEDQPQESRGSKISNHPELCFQFNQTFLEKYTSIKLFRSALQKSQKQKPTMELLQRLDANTSTTNIFETHLISYQKLKGWNSLMETRNNCFWLQSDFIFLDNSIQKKNQMEKSFRFLNQSFTGNQGFQQTRFQKKIGNTQKKQSRKRQQQEEENEEYFSGVSDTESQSGKQQMINLAPCSKRVATKRMNNSEPIKKKIDNAKILCHYSLQKIFVNLYNYLKLQNDCEKWVSKLNFQQVNEFSKDKKQLIAIILIKKGLFHKKLHRYRKCEQSLKLARKYCQNIMIGIISSYNLAALYLQHQNIKGVEFYTIQLVRHLWSLGIQQYDIIPIWSKSILPFILRIHGKQLIKNLNGPLKQLVQKWIELSEQKLYLKNKK